jgi:hypothetical protein
MSYSPIKRIKYQIIRVEAFTHEVEILKTTDDLNEANFFINQYIDKNFDLGAYTKAFHENCTTVSIYEYGMIMPKCLICKIHIKEYEDC